MAGLFADLAVKISANASELKKGTGEAKNAINKFGKQAKKNGKQVQGSFKKLGDSARGLGSQITGQMGIAGDAIEALAGSFTGTIKGVQGATSAMKVFKVALASTGIGLLVVALGSLVAYFTKMQKGADMLSKAMAGVGAVVDVVVDSLAALGGGIIDAFSNPKETVKGFGESIGTFIMDKIKLLIKGVKGIGTAFTLLFEGEFKKAAKQAGNSLLDITKATSPVAWGMEAIGKATEYVTEKYGEASDEANRAMQLQKDAIALEEQKMKDQLRSAELQVKLSDLVRKSKEKENFTEEQRLKFVKEAQKVQEQLSNIQIRNAKEELRIKTETDKLANNMRSDDQETVDLKEKLILLDKERNDKQRELQNRINEANTQLDIAVKKENKINDELREREGLLNDLSNIPDLEAEVSLKPKTEDGGIKMPSANIKPVEIPVKMKQEAAKAEMDLFFEGLVSKTEKVANKISEFSNAVGQIMSNVFEAKSNKIEQNFQKEKEAIESSVMSERQKAKAIQKLEEETGKKKAEIAKKSAIAEKAQAVLGIGVNTAMGITKAVAASPLTAGMPWSGIIAAIGATQMAAALSQPLPKFATGGIVAGAPTGDQNLIRANGGEMMLNKSQQSNMFDMINRGGVGTQNINITGRLVGSGNDLVAVIDETQRRNSNNY